MQLFHLADIHHRMPSNPQHTQPPAHPRAATELDTKPGSGQRPEPEEAHHSPQAEPAAHIGSRGGGILAQARPCKPKFGCEGQASAAPQSRCTGDQEMMRLQLCLEQFHGVRKGEQSLPRGSGDSLKHQWQR